MMKNKMCHRDTLKEDKMKEWLNEWRGTNSEINDLIEFYLDKIVEEFSVERKKAKKYLCEALSRNLIVAEVDSMLNYLHEEENT